MPSTMTQHIINFDIDHFLNPWVPRNRLDLLPRWMSHFLGYRSKTHTEPPGILQWIISLLATVTGLVIVGVIFTRAPGIAEWAPPSIIASLGASAVLDYNTVQSPLSQPRNAILGNTLSAIVGVAIAAAFQLSPDFENITWVSGAVACAIASLVMSWTNTIHPPGGATAVLASTDAQILRLGWRFVPLSLLGSTILVVVALLFNNIFRRYPVFWWSPNEVGQRWHREKTQDLENAKANKNSPSAVSDTSSQRTLKHDSHARTSFQINDATGFYIDTTRLSIPSHIELADDELAVLRRLQDRLQLNS